MTVGSTLTPAERVAVYQVLSTGQQSVLLSSLGNAIGGSFTIGSRMGNSLNNLVVPQGVTLIDKSPALNVSGVLNNLGILNVIPSNPANTTTSISAASIFNGAGAQINSNLNLNLLASNNIVNLGVIRSTGNLNLSAGSSIINNSGATMQAAGNVGLLSRTGTFINNGMISATTGSITLASAQAATAININAIDGTFQALNGTINIGDASLGGANNINLLGGNYISKQLNLYAGSGSITANLDKLTGVLNAQALSEHTLVSTPDLYLGNNAISGDPTFVNDGGDITITGNVSSGEAITIVASGNINASGDAFITETGGAPVTLVAGANVTVNSGNGTVPGQSIPGNQLQSGATVTVDFSGGTGGNIDLTGSTHSAGPIISTTPTNPGAGGSVILAAYANGSNTGQILFPSSVDSINTSGNGAGNNGGNVLLIAGSADLFRPAIWTSNIITTDGGAATAGTIQMVASQPAATSGTTVTFDSTGAAVSNGVTAAFLNSGNTSDLTNGPILVTGSMNAAGNLGINGNAGNGGSIIVNTQGSLTVYGDINAAGGVGINGNTGGNGGSVTITTGEDISVLGLIFGTSGSVFANGGIGNGSVFELSAGTGGSAGQISLTTGGALTVNGDVDAYSYNGNVNDTNLNSSGAMSIGGNILSFSLNGNGGLVHIINSDTLNVNGNIMSFGIGGAGGGINYHSTNDMIIGNIDTHATGSLVSGSGANTSVITSDNGSITTGWIDTSNSAIPDNQGFGGPLVIRAANNITVGDINATGDSATGASYVFIGAPATPGSLGAFVVITSSNGNVTTGNINTSVVRQSVLFTGGASEGGTIFISATNGTTIQTGNLIAHGTGFGGNVTVIGGPTSAITIGSSTGTIVPVTTQGIDTSVAQEVVQAIPGSIGGPVSIVGGSITINGGIDTHSTVAADSHGGDVVLLANSDSNYVSNGTGVIQVTGAIDTHGSSLGGLVELIGQGGVSANSITTSAHVSSSGEGGRVLAVTNGTLTISGNIDTSGQELGGDVLLTSAGGAISTAKIITGAFNLDGTAHGGDVLIAAANTITVSDTIFTGGGFASGNVALVAQNNGGLTGGSNVITSGDINTTATSSSGGVYASALGDISLGNIFVGGSSNGNVLLTNAHNTGDPGCPGGCSIPSATSITTGAFSLKLTGSSASVLPVAWTDSAGVTSIDPSTLPGGGFTSINLTQALSLTSGAGKDFGLFLAPFFVPSGAATFAGAVTGTNQVMYVIAGQSVQVGGSATSSSLLTGNGSTTAYRSGFISVNGSVNVSSGLTNGQMILGLGNNYSSNSATLTTTGFGTANVTNFGGAGITVAGFLGNTLDLSNHGFLYQDINDVESDGPITINAPLDIKISATALQLLYRGPAADPGGNISQTMFSIIADHFTLTGASLNLTMSGTDTNTDIQLNGNTSLGNAPLTITTAYVQSFDTFSQLKITSLGTFTNSSSSSINLVTPASSGNFSTPDNYINTAQDVFLNNIVVMDGTLTMNIGGLAHVAGQVVSSTVSNINVSPASNLNGVVKIYYSSDPGSRPGTIPTLNVSNIGTLTGGPLEIDIFNLNGQTNVSGILHSGFDTVIVSGQSKDINGNDIFTTTPSTLGINILPIGSSPTSIISETGFIEIEVVNALSNNAPNPYITIGSAAPGAGAVTVQSNFSFFGGGTIVGVFTGNFDSNLIFNDFNSLRAQSPLTNGFPLGQANVTVNTFTGSGSLPSNVNQVSASPTNGNVQSTFGGGLNALNNGAVVVNTFGTGASSSIQIAPNQNGSPSLVANGGVVIVDAHDAFPGEILIQNAGVGAAVPFVPGPPLPGGGGGGGGFIVIPGPGGGEVVVPVPVDESSTLLPSLAERVPTDVVDPLDKITTASQPLPRSCALPAPLNPPTGAPPDAKVSWVITTDACQPIFFEGDDGSVVFGTPNSAFEPQERTLLLKQGMVLAISGKEGLVVKSASGATANIPPDSAVVVEQVASGVKMNSLRGLEIAITVGDDGKTQSFSANAGEDIIISDTPDASTPAPARGIPKVSKPTPGPSGSLLQRLSMCSVSCFPPNFRKRMQKVIDEAEKLSSEGSKQPDVSYQAPDAQPVSGASEPIKIVWQPADYIMVKTPSASPVGLQTLQTSAVTIKASAFGAKVLTPKADEVNLHEGQVLLSTQEKILVVAGDYSVEVDPNAMVLIDKEKDLVKVGTIWSRKPNAVRVKFKEKDKYVAIAEGQDCVLGPNNDSIMGLLLKDKVARRNIRGFDLPGGQHFSCSEFSFVSMMQNTDLLSKLSKSQAPDDRALSGRIIRMAACIAFMARNRGNYTVVGYNGT